YPGDIPGREPLVSIDSGARRNVGAEKAQFPARREVNAGRGEECVNADHIPIVKRDLPFFFRVDDRRLEAHLLRDVSRPIPLFLDGYDLRRNLNFRPAAVDEPPMPDAHALGEGRQPVSRKELEREAPRRKRVTRDLQRSQPFSSRSAVDPTAEYLLNRLLRVVAGVARHINENARVVARLVELLSDVRSIVIDPDLRDPLVRLFLNVE